MLDPDRLKIGDRFHYRNTEVTIVGQREPHRDRFGQEQFKYLAERSDTGKVGWLIFGPGAAHLQAVAA